MACWGDDESLCVRLVSRCPPAGLDGPVPSAEGGRRPKGESTLADKRARRGKGQRAGVVAHSPSVSAMASPPAESTTACLPAGC